MCLPLDQVLLPFTGRIRRTRIRRLMIVPFEHDYGVVMKIEVTILIVWVAQAHSVTSFDQERYA